MPYRIWGVDAVSSGVFLLGPQAGGVDRHPHYLAMISRQTLEEQLVHPDYGDSAMPIDIPPSLRGARPVVPRRGRKLASGRRQYTTTAMVGLPINERRRQ